MVMLWSILRSAYTIYIMSEFIDAYNAIVPPVTLEVSTGPEETVAIHEKTAEYFNSIREALGFQAVRFDHLFPLQPLATSKGIGYPQHDTELYTYRFCGYQTLAVSYDERDDYNYHVVSFLKFPLRPGVIELIDLIHNEIGPIK